MILYILTHYIYLSICLFVALNVTYYFNSGALLTEINDQFSAKANQTLQPDRKLYFLGGHDVTIIALLHSIGIKKSLIIKPGDMVLLELHENENFYSVKVSTPINIFYVSTSDIRVNVVIYVFTCIFIILYTQMHTVHMYKFGLITEQKQEVN